MLLFQGKREGRSFCHITKGIKKTEKGRGIPLPFSNPIPLPSAGKANYLVYAGLAETVR